MYREHASAAALQEHVVCLWQHAGVPSSSQVAWIVPDACLDIVWNGRALRVAGPDTRACAETLASAACVVGLRFRTGRASAILGTPASALRDARVDLSELWGDAASRLRDLLLQTDAAGALGCLQRAALERRASWLPADSLIDELVRQLQSQHGEPELRVAGLARTLGVSERQLHRRCTAQVGYGPKLLARIVRMRRFREALKQRPHCPLVTLAAELGFVDQAHLSHEAQELYGRTPGELQKVARKRALSDFHKTESPAPYQVVSHGTTSTSSRAR